MTPEIQARMFEPFFSTKGERGTGLGLAQVFGIVEHHGAEVTVDSAPGRGTTFRLTFAAAPPPRQRRDSQTKELEAPVGRRLRILAVDDEPAMGSMIRRMLRPDGHTVVTATAGEEALESLAADHFDVVISDVGLGPRMNGWELAAEIRRRRPGLPLVLATGWGAMINPAEARANGIHAVLAKPYAPADLQNILARLSQPDVYHEAA
jgi:CheY-like chemotaxis protein